MSDLANRLARLGLSQYLDFFVAEGFDTWETVLDITESDLSHLNVKLGHRRKLQRAIAESRGQFSDRPLPATFGRTTSGDGSYRSGDDSTSETRGKQGEISIAGTGGTSTKRKYRRRPKPDENAPERPASAYVIFSNHVRESLKGQDLSFTEIAKVVGEKWQVLPASDREGCERQANGAKEKYYAELAEYKKTLQFQTYQIYLEDFKAKHAAPTKEGKRSKMEPETTTSSRGGHDLIELGTNTRLSSVQPKNPVLGYHRPDSSQPMGPSRLPAGPSNFSKPTSPGTHPPSGYNTPRTGEPFSPVSASPRSIGPSREVVFDPTSINPARDQVALMEPNISHPSTYSSDVNYPSASTTPPSYSFNSHYQSPVELPSRRPVRGSTRLPLLSHDDRTLSSESGQSSQSLPLNAYTMPLNLADPNKTMRILPQPVPNLGPLSSPLDRPPPPIPLPQPQHHHDYRTQGPLAVLLIAGELAAREADEEAKERQGTN